VTDVLTQFSKSLTERTAAARGLVAAIRISDDRYLAGTLWGSTDLVTSEQSLPESDEFDIAAAGGDTRVRLAGRDPGTNIAVLRLPQPVSSSEIVPAEATAGEVALAFGADGVGGVTYPGKGISRRCHTDG